MKPYVEIKLSQGLVTIVDREDEDLVALRWHARDGRGGKYYAGRWLRIGARRQCESLHRVVIGRVVAQELDFVDHVNGDTLDNRRSNLRPATRAQNGQNTGARYVGASAGGLRGVSFHSPRGRWCARIRVGGKQVSLGYFDNVIEAAIAYDNAARSCHGAFANTNYPAFASGRVA